MKHRIGQGQIKRFGGHTGRQALAQQGQASTQDRKRRVLGANPPPKPAETGGNNQSSLGQGPDGRPIVAGKKAPAIADKLSSATPPSRSSRKTATSSACRSSGDNVSTWAVSKSINRTRCPLSSTITLPKLGSPCDQGPRKRGEYKTVDPPELQASGIKHPYLELAFLVEAVQVRTG